MKKSWRILVTAMFLAGIFAASAMAAEPLVRFRGGIGVIPVSRVDGNPTPASGNALRNDVHGVQPGGQPWVIARLRADVDVDGRIRVQGRGLLLAGGNGIGTNGGQSVMATLFCGTDTEHNSGAVALEPDGDFRIDDTLTPTPPNPCDSPVLLIRNSPGGRWFAAGIPRQ